MNFKEIQELIKLIEKSDLAEFKLKNPDIKIHIKSQKCFEGNKYVSAPITTHVSTPPVPAQPAPNVVVSATPTLAPTNVETPTASENKKLVEVKSPMVGTFYLSSGPGKPPFVSVGSSIQKGSVVCIIEAMKLFNEIESEFSGKVVEIKVKDATPVEYDQVLFVLEQ